HRLARAARRRVKVGRLVRDPIEKLRDRLVGAQPLWIIAEPRELGVGEVGMDCPVADRVDGNGGTALLRLGHRMVPLQPLGDRAAAEPADKGFASHASAIPFPPPDPSSQRMLDRWPQGPTWLHAIPAFAGMTMLLPFLRLFLLHRVV